MGLGIRAYYEPFEERPFTLELPPSSATYHPDFVIDAKLDGRIVTLNPHRRNGFSQNLEEGWEAYGNLFYYILLMISRSHNNHGVPMDGSHRFVDRILPIPKITFNPVGCVGPVPGYSIEIPGTGLVVVAYQYQRSKEFLRGWLAELLKGAKRLDDS